MSISVQTLYAQHLDDAFAEADIIWDYNNTDTWVLVIPHTEYSKDDGIGTTYTRANHEALKRDFPDLRADEIAGLIVPLNGTVSDELAEALTSFTDGLYDECYHWELEHTLMLTDWENSGRDGLIYTLENLAGGDDDTLVDLKVSNEWLDTYFFQLARDYSDWEIWQADYADGGTFNDQTMQEIAGQMLDLIVMDWNARVTWLADRQAEGLF